jgi:hypothetical protein
MSGIFIYFIKESLHKRRRANQQLILSNYNYDPRAHLQPVDGLLEISSFKKYCMSNRRSFIYKY